MKKVLIIYSKMIIGGSTTSLLSLLGAIQKFNDLSIELLLFEDGGELFSEIPSGINVTVLLDTEKKRNDFRKQKKFSLHYIYSYIRGSLLSKGKPNKLIRDQLTGIVYPQYLPKINKEYDVAISFLEFGVLAYNAEFVNAKKKIGWVHVDYYDTGLLGKVENKVFSKMDYLVMVSDKCVTSFKEVYPQFSNKTLCIENIFSAESVRKRNVDDGSSDAQKIREMRINNSKMIMISVSRIVFSHKGHDRIVAALIELRKKYDLSNLMWVVVGDGPDYFRLRELIKENNLENNVLLLGAKDNAIPYIASADVLIMASRYEGKPMVICEAHIMGVPVVSTGFSSAMEAIEDDYDGKVFCNTDQGVYDSIEWIILNSKRLSSMSETIRRKDYSNSQEADKIYGIIREEGRGYDTCVTERTY